MADITKCSGDNCPIKENCYRFTAVENEYRQSYFIKIPYNHESKICDYFMKVLDKKDKK
jgi:hypothetical protein